LALHSWRKQPKQQNTRVIHLGDLQNATWQTVELAGTILELVVNDLVSNWAYMVMAALAWNLKAWFGLLVPNRERGLELVKMEFRRFLYAVMLLPCQVVRTARRVIYRVLSYNSWLKDFFATWERMERFSTV